MAQRFLNHRTLLLPVYFILAGALFTACDKKDFDATYQDPSYLDLAVTGAAAGDTLVTAGSQVQYGTYTLQSSSTYTWKIPADAAIVSGSGTNIVKVQFGLSSGPVSVSAGNITGQVNATIQFNVSGTSTPAVGASVTYTSTAIPLTGVTYQWTLPADAVVVSGAGTNKITVQFTTAGAKTVACQASDSAATLNATLAVTAS
jgi:hypothetical protein